MHHSRSQRRPFVGHVFRILFVCFTTAILCAYGRRGNAQGTEPDLVVSGLDPSGVTGDWQKLSIGGVVRVEVTNVGGGPAVTVSTLVLFEDANRTGAFEAEEDLLLGEAEVPELESGEVADVEASVSGTVLFRGNLIFALADSDDVIAESNEGNNSSHTGDLCEGAPPSPSFVAEEECVWNSSEVVPNALNVLSNPAVADLDGDGTPDVLFGSTASTRGGFVEAGYLRALRGHDWSELFTVTDSAYRLNVASPPAVGDIDLDGRPEIVACRSNGSELIAFEHDGSFKWFSPSLEAINWGGPAIADLEGDGFPEIIIGREVLEGDGTLRWRGTGGRGSMGAGPLSLVADVNLDGVQEVVGGNTVYNASGDIIWKPSGVPDGLNAVANFDDDPFPEIVHVRGGVLRLFEDVRTEHIKWSVSIPGSGGRGGPPTVADYDGDGLVEIGVAGSSRYSVFEHDGTHKWSSGTQDGSAVTGSSVFDFEGDGAAEVVYRDERRLRVYDGRDGTVLFQTPMSSCTWHEYVFVVDVDADGSAEIVAPANNNCGRGPQRGVFVFGHPEDRWVGTRGIWNQHTYHITNVNDDGTIPTPEQPNWLVPPGKPYNSYRQNILAERPPLAAPDLAASFIRVECDRQGSVVIARIGNGGSRGVEAGVPVSFYDGDPGMEARLLGTAFTGAALSPGSFEDVRLALPGDFEGRSIHVVADDPGGLINTIEECNDVNNRHSFTQDVTICGAPIITEIPDAAALEGEPYVGPLPELVYANPPVRWSLVTGPSGLMIDPATGVVSWPEAVAAVEPHRITVRVTDLVGADTESWLLTVAPSYDAEVEVAEDPAGAGTPVTLRGHAFRLPSEEPALSVPVSITLELRGTRRVLRALTDDSGRFELSFRPLATEAGRYGVFAHHPAARPGEVQDEFVVVALLASPLQRSVVLVPGVPLEGTIELRNPGDTDLSGVQASSAASPGSMALEVQVPDRVPALGSAEVTWTLAAADDSVPEARLDIVFTTLEGAGAAARLDVRVLPLEPRLVADPASLSRAMVRGEETIVEFDVVNRGGRESTELSIDLPRGAPWLSLVSPSEAGPLAPGDTVPVTLALRPAADLPLGSYTGAIVVSDTATSLTIPFDFRAVTDGVGDLRVIAEDELTYWGTEGADGTERLGPFLANVTVTVRAVSGAAFEGSGVTDESGSTVFEGIPAGYYEITAEASGHGGFRAVVLVPAGGRTVHAFLPRETVRYEWRVEPTQVEDRYDVRLDAIFETNVPVPVITVDPPFVDLRKMDRETTQIDFTITNHGLIRADDVRIVTVGHPRYGITPLLATIGDLDPGQSVTVPAAIRDGRFLDPGGAGRGDCLGITFGVRYSLVCAVPLHYWVPVFFRLPGCPVTTPGGSSRAPSPPGGGGGGGGAGPVGNGGGSGPVTNPDRPFVRSPPPYVEEIPCDPCDVKRAKAVLDCLLDLLNVDCAITTAKDAAECAFACSRPDDRAQCAKKCVCAAIAALSCFTPAGCALETVKTVGSCADDCMDPNSLAGCVIPCVKSVIDSAESCEDVIGKLHPAVGIAATVLDCGFDILTACEEEGDGHGGGIAGGLENLHDLETHLRRPADITDAFTLVFGDEVWLAGQLDDIDLLGIWLVIFLGVTRETSEDGAVISLDERVRLHQTPRPRQLGAVHIDAFVARWNRTQSYWSRGIFDSQDVPEGENTDFIALDVWEVRWDAARRAVVANEKEGFDGLYEGVRRAMEEVLSDVQGGGAMVQRGLRGEGAQAETGICARVRIRIDQRAVITRSGFRATLEVTNGNGGSALEDVSVEIDIRDGEGRSAGDRFGVFPPLLTGIDSLDGRGVISAGGTARAQWTIVPTDDAAPFEATDYFVGGLLTYSLSGTVVEVPLFPAPITVHPNPSLALEYFLPEVVFGDDPFTEEIEPPVPFSLGLLVCNSGPGDLIDMHVTSAQPRIIENERRLIIDFEILGTEVNGRNLPPALRAELGDIEPGGAAVARWLLVSSLQGEITDFSAAVTHLDGLGDRRLSLVDSAEVHLLEHVVRVHVPEDDDKPDFLKVETPNDQRNYEIRSSDCRTLPVELVTQATVKSDPFDPDSLRISTAMPPGWSYLRIDDPAPKRGRVLRVVRTDGTELPGDNFWQTRRTIRSPEPTAEALLHVLDHDSGGSYLVTYEPGFKRGDANRDGQADLSDGVVMLNFLFVGGEEPVCRDAADVNDDGMNDISDPIRLFSTLFLGGAPLPDPGPEECGPDPTDDLLDCLSPTPCESD